MEEERSQKKKLMPDEPPAAASLLTDDLIVEILSRLPVRSVHRFKCVSKHWRDLIAHPAHRKKLPQTLAGFLYTTYPGGHRVHFASTSRGAATADLDHSLSFLQPIKYRHIELLDTCNGLLLCAGYNPSAEDEFRFVVCNPATKRWVELPPHPARAYGLHTMLAFDSAVSSHFRVLNFELSEREGIITGANIYSSQTGAWTHRDSGLGEEIVLTFTGGSVFFGGMMYLLGALNRRPSGAGNSDVVLVAVDMEVKAWCKIIPVPPNGMYTGIIGLSQGCLHYATTVAPIESGKPLEISLWCLQNHDSKEWLLKHSVSVEEMSSIDKPLYIGDFESQYMAVGIHPDCDTLFLVPWSAASFASYDVRRQSFCHILDLEEGSLPAYLPYVPLFSESLADADGQ